MTRRLAAVAAVLAVCAATTVPAAAAGTNTSPRPIHPAAGCSTITVHGGQFLGTVHVRFALIGPVMCAKAHSLARTWLYRFGTGRCGQVNNFCVLQFHGGWSCSAFPATESRQAGGAAAGCARLHPTAKIRLFFKAHPQGQQQ